MPELKVTYLQDKKSWEDFILKADKANFLQSYNWGLFQKNLGKKVFYFALLQGKNEVGCALAVKEEAKRATYLTIAGGPIVSWEPDHFKVLLSEIKKAAKVENCSFIRIRPQELNTPEMQKIFSTNGFVKAPMHLTADLTLQLDLIQSEELLLAQMRKNTRYEVKKAVKLGISVKKSKSAEDIRRFHRYQLQLAKKHRFVPFSLQFLAEQFKVFVKDDQALLVHAYLADKLLASAFVIFYGKEAVYHYGISTPDNDHLPGAYACQWEAIKEAKKRGLERYNLWGVAPKSETGHRFYGVSIFKRGFGGEEVEYLPAQDLPLSPGYYLTYCLELVRKKARKL